MLRTNVSWFVNFIQDILGNYVSQHSKRFHNRPPCPYQNWKLHSCFYPQTSFPFWERKKKNITDGLTPANADFYIAPLFAGEEER